MCSLRFAAQNHPLWMDVSAVAVVARLDAVDLAVQLVLELGDVGEVLDAGLRRVLRHRQGVLGALQVDAEHLDRTLVAILGEIAFHGRHPVAEEDVDVAVLQAGVSHRHGEHLRFRLVAEAFQHHRGGRRGRGDVGPADVGEIHFPAGRRVGGLGGSRRRQGQRGRGRGENAARARFHDHVSASLFFSFPDLRFRHAGFAPDGVALLPIQGSRLALSLRSGRAVFSMTGAKPSFF